jgi:hypothetical protein
MRAPHARPAPSAVTLAVLWLLVTAPAAHADLAADSCPLLPANSGLTWTYQGGDDFGVCYASGGGSAGTVFGIYFGNTPTFDPSRATAVAAGNVGGHAVTWYRHDSAAGGDAFSLQTLVYVSKRYVAHVWVAADSEAQLQQRLAILKQVRFKP